VDGIPLRFAFVIVVLGDTPTSWTAVRDGDTVGQLRALVRPDQRCHLFFRDTDADAYDPLLAAAIDVLRGAGAALTGVRCSPPARARGSQL
jgi:hypothetical protein